MPIVYLIQHAEKQRASGEPALTALGMAQAAQTARWLAGRGVRSLFSSPQRRAWQTAEVIASELWLTVVPDPRLRERSNWAGTTPFEAFLADWQRSVEDRDYVPGGGDSSRQAGERMRAFVAGLPADHGPVAAVTHGGLTVDLLRTMLGDDQVPDELLSDGVPPCAITTLDGLNVTAIASVAHMQPP
ncbi:MAG TPA: histidine phosphatase family protein [Streptosporangiaceae bacterium]|nr:histidine phosphatase family protein [Streptosporangiaceae bacterium]